jgi:hypothetical protein
LVTNAELGFSNKNYSYIFLFKELIPCNIFALLQGVDRVMVAHRRIHPSGLDDTVHHESFRPDEIRVAIEQVLEGFDSLPLPFPNEEQEYLGHAKGGFVKWPAWLVDRCE